MTATWPAVADLGDIARHTFRPFTPDEFPTRRDPALEQRDTEIVGRLRFLIGEIAYQAGEYEVPADLARLIGQAQQIVNGDLGRAAA